METDPKEPEATEVIEEEGRIPVLVIAPYGPSFPDVIRELAKDPKIQLIECSSSLQAVSLVQQLNFGILLFHGAEFRDVVKDVAMLKLLKDPIKDERIRTIFTSYFRQVSVISKLTYYGCKEIVNEPVTAKALLFKVHFHVKALEKMQWVQEVETDASGQLASVRSNGVSQGEGDQPVPTFRYAPALGLKSDFWFLPDSSPRMIGKRWVIKILGPEPAVGKWVSSGQDENWIWKPLSRTRHPFMEKDGTWVFQGQRPQFKRDFWLLVGENPSLEFVVEGKVLGSKISIDPSGMLVLARNSDAATQAVSLFRAQASRSLFARNDQKSVGKKRSQEDQSEPESSPPVSDKRHETKGLGYTMVGPLTIKSDCWLLEERKPKWMNEHWVIRFKGPPTSAGRWVEVLGNKNTSLNLPKEKSKQKSWRWVPSQPDNDPYIVEAGSWEFSGFAPRYDEGVWMFVSKSPQLVFVNSKDFKIICTKVGRDKDGVILVARDSVIAEKVVELPGNQILNDEIHRDKVTPDKLQRDKIQKNKLTKGKIPPEEESVLTDDLKVDVRKLGNPPGKWQKFGFTKDGKSKFIYIPFEIVNELSEARDISEFDQYWVYTGAQRPDLISELVPGSAKPKKMWIFQDQKPDVFASFSELSPEVQSFLKKTRGVSSDLDLPSLPHSTKLKAIAAIPKRKILDLELSQPKLTPLALALLLSELAVQSNREVKEIARCFCKWVSGSFDGVRTELWIHNQGRWTCANTGDGSEGEYQNSFENLESFPQMTSTGTLVAPVVFPQSDDSSGQASSGETIAGALVFGGPGVERVSVDSAQSYSMMAKGLVQGFF